MTAAFRRPARMAAGVLLAAATAFAAAGSGLATADPAAQQALSDARQHRQLFAEGFPGFRSQLLITLDGVEHRGSLEFAPPTKLEIKLPDAELRKRVKRTVKSMLSHRMASSSSRREETVRFGAAGPHPLGRKILLGDKYESSYRIRDNQIFEVDRNMGEKRLIITVLETVKTSQGRYLPKRFFVTVFDRESGAIEMASVYADEYREMGGSYVPVSRTMTGAKDGSTETFSIEMKEIELLPAREAR